MKILLCMQTEDQEQHLSRLLSEDGYAVVPAKGGRAALRALQSDEGPRIALMDDLMSEFSAEEVCRRLRASGAPHYTYCIVSPASECRNTSERLFESGADDVLVRPFDFSELSARLRNAKRVVNLQEQLIAARQALHFESTHDGATGVYNRQGLADHLRRESERAARFR
ncbi:MAG: hypothetical protein NVS9B15_09300 [Acidobacteriaceae bacterium]